MLPRTPHLKLCHFRNTIRILFLKQKYTFGDMMLFCRVQVPDNSGGGSIFVSDIEGDDTEKHEPNNKGGLPHRGVTGKHP